MTTNTCNNCGGPRRTAGKSTPPGRAYCSKPDCVRARNRMRMREFGERKRAELGRSYYRDYHRAAKERDKAAVAAGTRESRRKRNPDSFKAADHRRRALKHGVGYEIFKDSEIFERDGWICQLCGDPIERDAKAPQDLSVSLDHIVSLSNGGAHSPENSQCAHYLCNSRKGNRDADI